MPRRSIALLLTLALVGAACSDDSGSEADGAPSTSGPTAPAGPETGNDPETGSTVAVEGVDTSPLAARVRVQSDTEVTVQITATAADHEVATPVTAASATEHDLPLVGLRAERDYSIAVALTDADGTTVTTTDTFTTGSLPDGLPNLEITSDPSRSSPGITILELNPVDAVINNNGNPVVGVDGAGEIVWYYGGTGSFTGAAHRTPAGGVSFQHDPFAFSVEDITSRRLAEYYPDPAGTATITEGDDGRQLIPYHADWVELGPIHHDLVPMTDGSFLGLSTTEHPVPADQRAALCPGDDLEWNIASDVVMHVAADGEVMRTWDLYDVLSFDDHPGEFLCQQQGLGITPTRRDWTHANALWFDADRNAIIVSSRHTDQLVALEMTDETGPQTGVRWILGNDATMPYDGESFHHTHGVKVVSGGDILFYDNGNFRPGTLSSGGTEPDYSRAVRIRVDDAADDPSTWSATQIWDHRMTDPLTDAPVYAPFISDADELANGNILVTHGGAVSDPARQFDSHVIVVEIVPDAGAGDADEVGGEIVWELRVGDDANPVSMYRADRWETLYFGPLWATG